MNLDVVKLNPTEWIQRAYRLNLTRIPSSYPTSCPTFRIWLIENKQIPDSLSRPHWRYVRWSLFFVSCGMNSIIRSVHSTCITSSNVLRFFEKIVFLFLSYRKEKIQENLLRFPFRIVWIIDLDRPWWNRLKKHLQYFHSNWERKICQPWSLPFIVVDEEKKERETLLRDLFIHLNEPSIIYCC